MTCIIDSCFESKITNIETKKKQHSLELFLSSLCIQLKRKLVYLNPNTYCITFPSKNHFQKIKYFTILTIFESYVNTTILPYDCNGCTIRSKQNFNKNGWIRKHINQNKNKYLKINPLTGQAYFKYSCFIPQKAKISKFWNEMLVKIGQIQFELTDLLNKIINLQGKQKPLTCSEQTFQSNKLITSIKLAQMFKQNVKIQDQFHKLNLQLLYKQHQAEGYIRKLQHQKYSIQAKRLVGSQSQKSTIKTVFQQFLFFRKVLESSAVRVGKSNISSLTFSNEDQQRFKAKIKNMKFKEQARLKIQQFSREITILIKKQEDDVIGSIKRTLCHLNHDVQYIFLDTYFDQHAFDDVIMTLALKQQSLTEYLWKNFQTISYQTKCRILIQTLNSIITLWLKNQITFQNIGINSFTVTKNLAVKMKKLCFARFVHPCRLETQQAFLINNQKKQILKQFSNIYFEIFFNKKGPSIQSQKLRNKNLLQYKNEDLIFESLNELTKYYYPNNLFTLIIGLNYFFIQQYFNNFNKIQNIYKPESINFGQSNIKSAKSLEYFRKLQEAKKGGVRVDLILTMIIQFLQQHENKRVQKGGQL